MSNLERSLDLLEILAQNPQGLPFGRLKERVGKVTSPTLSRMLKGLIAADWACHSESGEYAPGERLQTMAAGLNGQIDHLMVLKTIVDKLAEKSGESAAHAEYHEGGFRFQHKNEQADSIHYISVGQHNPHLSNGFASMCLAWQNRKERRKYSMSEKQAGEIRSQNPLIKRDNSIRFVAPIFGKNNCFIGAIGISLIPRELDAKEIDAKSKLVQEHAKEASARLENFTPGA